MDEHEARELNEAVQQDAADCTTFHLLDMLVNDVSVYRMILGWDDSPLPAWFCTRKAPSYALKTRLLSRGEAEATIDASRFIEVRRHEPEIISWTPDIPSMEDHGILLPGAVYEFWARPEEFAAKHAAWVQADVAFPTGGFRPRPGYAGSTIVVLPRKRPFLRGVHELVVPGGLAQAQPLVLSETLMDGPVHLSTSSTPVRIAHDADHEDHNLHLQLAECEQTFAAIHAATPTWDVHVRRPTRFRTRSARDMRLDLSQGGDHLSSASVGLIGEIRMSFAAGDANALISELRSIATEQPWRTRVPEFGFSPDAQLLYIPARSDPQALAMARLWFQSDDGPIALCDPYASPESITAYLGKTRKLRVLMGSRQWRELTAIRQRDLRKQATELRTLPKEIHDRFLITAESAYVLGCSLNAIGSAHSFIVRVDHRHRLELEGIFNTLWENATPPA